jgi:ribose 5-phosphate isomerase B
MRSVRILAMRVHLGSDHAGLELKEHLLIWLAKKGHEAVDHGPFVYDAVDDYPPFCLRAAEAVVADREENLESFGIVIGGSGNGEQIAANKVRGVRAALVWSEETAVLARDHNDANVISVGGRMHSVEELTRFIDVFLHTPYSNGDRHDRRLGQIMQYERTGNLPPLPESALKSRP